MGPVGFIDGTLTSEAEARRTFRELASRTPPDLTRLLQLGRAAYTRGWVELARDVFAHGAGVCTPQTADDLVIGFIVGIATVLQADGEHAKAVELLDDMLRSARAHVPDPDLEHGIRLHLASSLLALRDTSRAAQHIAAVEVFAAERGADELAEGARVLRVALQGQRGDAAEAAGALRDQVRILAAGGAPAGVIARARLALAARLAEAGDVKGGRAEISDAIALLEPLADAAGLAWAYEGLGVLEGLDGEPLHALALLERSLSLAATAKDDRRTALAQRQAGRVLLRLARVEEASVRLLDALQRFVAMKHRVDEAETRLVLAEVAVASQVPEAARLQLKEARQLFEETGKRERVAHCDARLATLLGDP